MNFFIELVFFFFVPLIIIWILSKFNLAPKLNSMSVLESGIIVFIVCPIFALTMMYFVFTFPVIKDLNTLFLGGDVEKRISEHEAEQLLKQCKIGLIGNSYPGKLTMFLKKEYHAREYYVVETDNIEYLMNKYVDRCGEIPLALF